MFDRRHRARDFAGDECFAAARTFVVEQNAVASIQTIAFAIVHRRPIGKNLRHSIGTARPKRRAFGLRNLLRFAEHLAAGGLVKTRSDSGFTNCLQNTNRPHASDIRRVLGNVETHADMALGAEMIDLVRLQIVQQFHQIYRVGEITVVQETSNAVNVRIGVKMIDAGSVKRTRAADNPMHFITFRNQEIGKITAVLSRYAGNQGSLHPWRFRFSSQSANGQIIPSGCSRPALLAGRSAAEEARGATLGSTATERRGYNDRDRSSRRTARSINID